MAPIKRLGDLLVEAGVVTQEQVEQAVWESNRTGERLGEVLITSGVLSETGLAEALARQTGKPVVRLSEMNIPQAVLDLIPRRIVQRYCVIPIKADGNYLTIATTDPTDLAAEDSLTAATGYYVNTVITTPAEINVALERYYQVEVDIDSVLQALPAQANIEFLGAEERQDELSAAAAGPMARLVNSLIVDAVNKRASDIHIEPMENECHVRYRVDGILRLATTVPKGAQPALISRIKVISGLDIAERRKPQDGRTNLRVDGREIDLRVSILPTHFGEKAVMRILDKSMAGFGLEELGLLPNDLALLRSYIRRPQGMILITGPTGSGKTTTLYACLNEIKSETTNIVTVEDPIEYEMEGVNQVQVNERAGLTFAAALRSILRQDPNVIMVGEIRDEETAEIAFRAALTGHLVFSTVHTNDAPSAVTRLRDLGLSSYALGSSLLCVVAQRLARQVHTRCQGTYKPSVEDARHFHLFEKDGITPLSLAKGLGCSRCDQTGYRGRLGIFQILPVQGKVEELITQGASVTEIARGAGKQGMKTLLADGLEKIRLGLTTIEELTRVVEMDKAERRIGSPDESESDAVLLYDAMPESIAQTVAQVPRWEGSAKANVLIVDDSRLLLRVLQGTLEAAGYNVDTAINGQDALDKALGSPPDLIITDVIMPQMDGYQLVEKLKDEDATRDIPVIMLTSMGDVESEVKGLELGADEYLAKPLDPRRLLARIPIVLRRAEARHRESR